MPTYPTLFSPLTIGSVELPNRVALLPQGTGLAREGKATDEDIAYYEERAKGGVGLVITGGTTVHPSSQARGRLLLEAYDEEAIPSLQRRVRAVQAHGARIFGQILHLGRDMPAEASIEAPVAPSPLRSAVSAAPPHELSEAEIADLVECFAQSAVHLERAGYDGVEVHAAHGYLVGQFLSPATNQRSDAYGGTATVRMRFLLEIIEAVAQRLDRGTVLGVRLSVDEEQANGLGLDDTKQIIEALEETGAIDYLSLTIGVRGAYVKDMSFPRGTAVERIAEVSKTTDLPVVAAQRIVTPDQAEEIVSSGTAAAVGLSRALIADPAWPRKAQAGRATEIRPCVADSQECRTPANGGIACMVNPTVGREAQWGSGEIPEAPAPRRVVIVGGGPGGLEAARVAALRGHGVVLYERRAHLGGQIAPASAVPSRAELGGVTEHLEHELERLGVEVRTQTEATVASLQADAADVLVLATGAVPAHPTVSTDGSVEIGSVVGLLEGRHDGQAPDGRCVVADDGSGFWHSCVAAEYLALRGAHVVLATPAPTVGAMLPGESIAPTYQRLTSLGVRFAPLTAVQEARDGLIATQHVLSGEADAISAERLVVHAGMTPAHDPPLDSSLPAAEIHQIGDRVAPRRVTQAIYEGHRLARAL